MWAKNSIRAINKAKLQPNYILIIEKEVHQFRKQIKILPTKYRVIKQKISATWKVTENFSKSNSHDKQFHSGAILKEWFSLPLPQTFTYHCFRNSTLDKYKEELDLTPVCLPLTRVQYLFIGTFRTQICRYLNLPFIGFDNWCIQIKNITITLKCSLTSVPHQPTPQTQIFPCFCFCFHYNLVWHTLELHINGIIEYELLRRYHALSVTFWGSSMLLMYQELGLCAAEVDNYGDQLLVCSKVS